jgi:predicted dehydrogenase
MIRIGIVGIGFMGMIHFLAARRLDPATARVAAIASRDPIKRAGDWRGIRGNFGPPGARMDLAGVAAHATLEELLADPSIDLVDICLPTAQHAAAVRLALAAGKHVLVEKPITLGLDEADALVAAALRAGKLLMVGQVLPFFPEFKYLADFVRAGTGGRLLAAHFHRVISRPDWSSAIADAATSGGPSVDLHIHDTHFIHLLWGLPQAVSSVGVIGADGAVEHVQTQYRFGPGGPACVTSACGALCMKARPFAHGFEAYFEQATLVFAGGVQPLTLLTPDGGQQRLELSGGGDPLDAFALELTAAVSGVAAGKEPEALSGRIARGALRLCRAEEASVRTGKVQAMN